MKRLKYIDSLRGLAIIWIALFHLLYIPKPNLELPAWVHAFVARGDMGVTLFFIISSFSLCYTMRAYQGTEQSLLYYYMRRFFRIAPLYYIYCIVYIIRAWNYYIHGQGDLKFSEIIVNLFFIFNLFPDNPGGLVWASWVIGVLWIFYLVFPLLYKIFNNLWKCILLVLLSLLLAFATESLFDMAYFRWSFLRHLPMISVGMVVFYLLDSVGEIRCKRIVGIVLMGVALLVFILMLRRDLISYYWQLFIFPPLLIGFAFSPFKIIVNRTSLFLGKISYSMYLCHPILIFFLVPKIRKIYDLSTPLTIRYLIVVTMLLSLLITISFATYYLIEKPGIRLGKITREKLSSL